MRHCVEALQRAEIAVAVGFAAAMPLVAWLESINGFRLPFQVAGLLVLLNMVWIAVDPGALSPPAVGPPQGPSPLSFVMQALRLRTLKMI